MSAWNSKKKGPPFPIRPRMAKIPLPLHLPCEGFCPMPGLTEKRFRLSLSAR